jgi:hypothetical protein
VGKSGRDRLSRRLAIVSGFVLSVFWPLVSSVEVWAAPVTHFSLPPDFEINLGQTAPQVTFLSRGAGYTLFLTADGAVMRFSSPHASAGPVADRAAAVTMRWLGASPQPAIEGLEPLEARSNYFIGRDPSNWRTNVPHYAKVRYRGLYPGIDLVYYRDDSGGHSGEPGKKPPLEYDLIVAPGADPGVVRLAVDGAQAAVVDARGDLLLTTAAGKITQRRPVIYQEIDGARRPVAGSYVIHATPSPVPSDHGVPARYEIGVRVASYDAARPLVIDPLLELSTYWGGSGDDTATAVSVDVNTGSVFLAGYTDSVTSPGLFPTVNPVPGASVSGGDTYAFVTRLNASQTVVNYSTFVGGDMNEALDPSTTQALALDVDGSGAAYITGWTDATDFPIVPTTDSTTNALQVTYGGGSADAFVVKISKKGDELTYATYLGGTDLDRGNAIRVINNGSAYVAGTTASTDFPTQVPWQNVYGGGGSDAFMAMVDRKGTSLLFSTYLGGSGDEQGLALGSGGVTTLTGWTNSKDFPIHSNNDKPFQSTYGGGNSDAFVAQFSGDGKTLFYSTYLGGSGDDQGTAIVADPGGTAFVTGVTTSTNGGAVPFPTMDPIQADNAGLQDLFISQLNSSGETLRFSTYLGGSGNDVAYGIARSPEGFVYITGATMSGPGDPIPFPIQNPIRGTSYGGNGDAFLLRLKIDNTIDYSTYWGGDGEDVGRAIVIDNGAAYVTGTTRSTNLTTLRPIMLTTPSYDGGSYSGGLDVFLLKVLDDQSSGCDMGLSGWPFGRFGRIDLGLPLLIGLGGLFWRVRRARRVERAGHV